MKTFAAFALLVLLSVVFAGCAEKTQSPAATPTPSAATGENSGDLTGNAIAEPSLETPSIGDTGFENAPVDV
ncbi:TPA: hypothetical protein HA244_00980 [Candidatus Micrarchaeota archaeon]|nr:hypothetical protein [Candidatus Micrarchaeota archaeon]